MVKEESMTLKISVVVGNPNPKSRTRQVGETLVEKLFDAVQYELDVIDLADHIEEVFTWPSEKMDALTAGVAASDVVVFASPTYKATYTGLLKAFLDRYQSNGLAGVTAFPVMTGADRTHSMGPMVNLSPLLVELGASIPGRPLYFITGEMEQLDEVVQGAVDEYVDNLRNLAKIGSVVSKNPA